MLKNGMIVHDNYAMVFVIHNKAFPILNAFNFTLFFHYFLGGQNATKCTTFVEI
jgi:hypothetical protein